MNSEKKTKKNRYPGIRSFEAGDKNLFYGRSKEIDQLFNLIKIKPLVVLFGKSGLGKTSLLKAGVGPLLVKQNYYPVMIRLQDVGVTPAASVLSQLEPFVDNDLLNKYGNKSKNKIWEALKVASFKTADGATATPLLIFDQFEELFSHPKDVLEDFTAFVGDLIDNRLPEDIEEALNQVPRSERSKELMDWFRPPDVKIVFAIRSDRMSELHSLRYEIPAILQNRFELKPLKSYQAKEAIENPAALEGKDFLTAPFTYAPETVEKIQTELSNELGEIESFQLQIICQYIERKVNKEQAGGKQNVVVAPEYLGEAEGIREILKNYYNTQVSMLGTDEEQMSARKLLEEGLIVNNRRIGVAEAVVKETYNISDGLLEKLLSSRLIRPEDTRLGRTYEISHDTLVKPILHAYEKRRIKEEQIAAIEEQKKQRKEEEQQRIEKERKAKIIRLTTGIFLLAVISGIAFWGWWKANKALKDLRASELLVEEKQDALIQAEDSIALKEEKLESSIELLKANGVSTKEAKKEIEVRTEKKIEEEEVKAIGESPEKHADHERLIKKLYSPREGDRSKAASNILRMYKDDSELVIELINSTKGKNKETYKNSFYQIIYILGKMNSRALNANKNEVQKFLTDIKDSDLVGISTQRKLDEIGKKLNIQ